MEKGWSLLIYLVINSLFLLKYLARTSYSSVAVLAVYLVLVVIFAVLMGWFSFGNQTGKGTTFTRWLKQKIATVSTKVIALRINRRTSSGIQTTPASLVNLNTPWLYPSLAILTLLGVLVLQQLIDPMSIQVDRWSAIDHFLRELQSGNYPYKAQTHLGGYGSPFPAWNLFHLPFFLMGDVAFAMIGVLIVLIISLPRICGTRKEAFLYLLLLNFSPAFWYEVAVRSDLIYNFIVCFLICAWWYKKGIHVTNATWLTGIISGIMLSTRLSIVIPFFLFLFPSFLKASWKQRFQFVGIALAMFLLTFMPFILWDLNSLVFFEYNPFVLQTRQGSIIELMILTGMLIPLSLGWKSKLQGFTLYTALTILIFITATFIHRMIADDFASDLFSSRYDITYFNMALPFALYTLAKENKNNS